MPTRITGNLAQSQIILACVARMLNHTSKQLRILASRSTIVADTFRNIRDVVVERRTSIVRPVTILECSQ
jgi:hypothetical protein